MDDLVIGPLSSCQGILIIYWVSCKNFLLVLMLSKASSSRHMRRQTCQMHVNIPIIHQHTIWVMPRKRNPGPCFFCLIFFVAIHWMYRALLRKSGSKIWRPGSPASDVPGWANWRVPRSAAAPAPGWPRSCRNLSGHGTSPVKMKIVCSLASFSDIDPCPYTIWATVGFYCLRQVRHHVSESPIVLQGFLFLHILTKFSLCLSIVLKRVHLDPHPWRSLFARVGAHLCFCPCLSGPPSRCLGGLFNQQGFLERKWVLTCFGHSQLLTSKFIQPGHKTSVHHYNILPASTTYLAFCVTSRSPGALLERF